MSFSTSPPRPLQEVLTQAAVSLSQVEQNDSLTQVTDQIALETIAVAIPSEYVDRVQEELQKQQQPTDAKDSRFSQGAHGWSLQPPSQDGQEEKHHARTHSRGLSIDIDFGGFQGELHQNVPVGDASERLVHASAQQLQEQAHVIDINASVRDFVQAITADRDGLTVEELLPESTAEEIVADADIKPKDLDEPEMAAGTAVVAASDGLAVVADIISGEVAEMADIADAERAVIVDPATGAALSAVEEGRAAGARDQQQPLSYLIARHPVWIATGIPTATEIDESISHLDSLILALKSVQRELYEEGLSPGFETKASSKQWFRKHVEGVYETLPTVNVHTSQGPAIPVPSPGAAVKYYEGIRETWLERKRYVEHVDAIGGAAAASFCSCISDWAHNKGDVLALLSNQSLEQDMIREASDAVTARMAIADPGSMRGEAFDRLYAPEHCPTPESVGHLYVPKTSLRVVGGRDDYIRTLTELALRAENTIDIATCYLFSQDPAQRYILLDLL